MQVFKKITDQVRDYLSGNNYCKAVIAMNESCFNKLGAYLEEEGVDYSPETANLWFTTHQAQFANSAVSTYKMALLRIQDIYKHGAIQPEHDTRHLISYSILSDGLKKCLDDFLDSLTGTLSPETIDNHKHSCARFLIYMQRAGVSSIADITFELIIDFYQDDIHHGRYGKSQINSSVSLLMLYFFGKGLVPYGFTILIHYLSHGKRNSGCYWNDVPESLHEKIVVIMETSPTVNTGKLREYKDYSMKLHLENGYSKSARSSYAKAADLLILFLEMNGYGYNPEIAMAWFGGVSHFFGAEADTIRRSLCMIADYHSTSGINLEAVYRSKPRAFDLLPAWCSGAAGRYVDSKEKEGWEHSTMDMIRSSICRFCNYLDSIGIRSFKELEISHIKQFNIDDKHKTPYGKNAYNTRIRKFLIFLGENGYLSNPMLFVALTCTSAPREPIVVILTEEEMSELKEQIRSDESRLSLRKKAMLLLGLKMGLRASDVVGLEIDNINWDTASIRFIQEKTVVEVSLPMPDEVGNALFRYIMEERHKSESGSIFLSEKAPYKPIKRASCNRALKTALPDRNVEGSGFHVMRKTYATQLLRNGVGAGMVAEALGQRGTTSVHRYLSLDTGRMRLCPLSLDECGIGGWKDVR